MTPSTLGLLVGLALFGLATGLSFRNERVLRWRRRAITTIGAHAQRDIDLRRPWRWRFEALDDVSYHAQVWQFWRPLDSFITPRLRTALTPPVRLERVS